MFRQGMVKRKLKQRGWMSGDQVEEIVRVTSRRVRRVRVAYTMRDAFIPMGGFPLFIAPY